MSVQLVNQIIIEDIVDHIKDGHIQYCKQRGCDDNLISALACLDGKIKERLLKTSQSLFFINANKDFILTMIDNINKELENEQLIARALSLDASSALLQKIFGLSNALASYKRKNLNIASSKGRKKMLSEEMEHKVYSMWQESKHYKENINEYNITQEEFITLMNIAEKLSISLTVVSSIVMINKKK